MTADRPRLKDLREQRGWTQQEVADQIQRLAWGRQREAFNKKLGKRDPDAVREAWQRYYFRGELPDQTGPAPADHVNKRRLKTIRLGR